MSVLTATAVFAGAAELPTLAAVAGAVVVAGLGASLWAARDALPGRDALLAWIRDDSASGDGGGIVRTPGVSDEVVEAVCALRDRLEERVARHRTARRRAEQVERYESEFLSTVSHELRTPLNAILGFSQVLLDGIDGPLTADQREDVETIRASGQHLRELVDDVLDLARIESGLFTLARERVDLRPIVREVARLLEAQRRDKPVAIETEVTEPLPALDADPKRLRQIVMNLATNALKFTDRGSVSIEVAPDGDTVRVTVRDTGAGIPRDELASIFEEFTHVRSVQRKGQGAGLGLAICKRLVDLHGGRIEVESVVGQGAAFHVFLPVRSGS